MSPSQGSLSFSHLIIRIGSGSIFRSQRDRDAQSLNRDHNSSINPHSPWGRLWKKVGYSVKTKVLSVFQLFTGLNAAAAVSLGEIYCLRQDEWFTGTVTVFPTRGDMPKTIKIIRNGRHFYTRLTWQKYCSLVKNIFFWAGDLTTFSKMIEKYFASKLLAKFSLHHLWQSSSFLKIIIIARDLQEPLIIMFCASARLLWSGLGDVMERR